MDRIHETNPPSAKPLAGKVALVTGGNRGIGKAIALRLASLGSAVSICGRDTSTLCSTAIELGTFDVRVHSQPADVTQVSDVSALVQQTEAALGPISILVNNAGMTNVWNRFNVATRQVAGEWAKSSDTKKWVDKAHSAAR